jgi:outer membrane receptor protein involved in Fe transport
MFSESVHHSVPRLTSCQSRRLLRKQATSHSRFSARGAKTGWIYSYYLQDEWKIAPAVTLNLGARYDQFAEFVSERQLSPRINLVWQPTEATTFKLGYSRYFTPPPFELVASPDLALVANSTAAPAVTLDSTPKAERAHYFDVGATQIILPGLKAGIDVYYKIASDLLDEGQVGAPIFFTPFNYQKGWVKGVELTLSYELDNWSFYGNFAASQELGKKYHIGAVQLLCRRPRLYCN